MVHGDSTGTIQVGDNEEKSVKALIKIGKAVDTVEKKIAEVEEEIEGIEKVQMYF